MELHRKEKKSKQKAPRIPIKTYRWEDIRRERLRGGYPWTYLYKDPFDDHIEPDLFKMETRSKSASTLRRSSGLEIKEVTDGVDDHHRNSLTPEPSGYIVITEVPSDSESHSRARPSFSIEDLDEPEVLNLEEAESSDDISQYLDREEPTIEPEPITTTSSQVETVKEENERQERAKSEEPKRKRKRSIDSSYSRKSLSKLAFLKKLKDAKDKIKVPKLSLSKSKNSKQEQPIEKSENEPKAKIKAKDKLKPKTNENPVYIHIPLKPPEGETDEFSYLEFGEQKPEEEKKPEEKSEEIEEKGPEVQIKFESDERRFSGNPDDIVAFEIVKAETIDLEQAEKNGFQEGSDYLIIQQDDDSKNENMIIIMPGSDEPGPSRSDSSNTPSRQGSRKARAKSAEPQRKRKSSIESSYSRISLSKLGILKKLKDAKDKLMPKFSLGRTDSKKGSNKKSQQDLATPEDAKKDVPSKEVKKEETNKKSSGKEPKYIHIPLKPPPGVTDEFSFLEFQEKNDVKSEAEVTKKEEKEEESSIESPISPKAEGVQFIFLTPPSDDEILDHPEIPETPSSTESAPFPGPVLKELQKIAKDAVDEVTPKEILQPVAEEDNSIADETIETNPVAEVEKMVVDEEDGLKLTESAMAKQEQNIRSKEVSDVKSSLKSDGSPVLKKKVSFKRRSKDESKDGIYEDVQPPPSDDKAKTSDEHKTQLEVMGTSQSMSVDEEKSYLDEQKLIKSTSLEEDYNRWSKLSDHEYEPVNPPPEVTPAPPPAVHVIDTDQGLEQKPTSLASSTTSLERQMLGADGEARPEEPLTIQEMQTEMENKYFTQPSKQQTTVHTVTTVTTTEVEPQTPKSEGPGKFKKALKTQADKFKSKLHEMKRPKIKKPNLQKFKIEKPKFNLPKLPEASKISLPTFSLPRRTPTKRPLKQLSTESNAGDSKKNYFDFRTYPRLFRKKQKDDLDSFGTKSEAPEFATVPRTKRNEENEEWGDRESVRVPLRPEDSVESEDRESSVEKRMASHIRYGEDIDTEDAFEKENQQIHAASRFSHDYNSRWNHGSFHPDPSLDFQGKNEPVTDLDSPEDRPATHDSFDINTSKDIHSSESSLGVHRRGVLEEIDSDEFFLRQKGISQDNIEVGLYLSSEIREAFKSPTNALADMEREPRDFSYDIRASNQSLPETASKRKAVKKPKRKKTPHVSHEQISFDQDSELDNELPPSRPKRRSKKNRKPEKEDESIIPYQETITADVTTDILDNLKNERHKLMYENEKMQGREHPEIKVIDPYVEYDEKYESEEEGFEDEDVKPSAPPRRQKSLKSLNFSERDSILGDFNFDREPPEDVEIYKTQHEYIIPTPELPPAKPERTLSRSSSRSRDQEETPIRPTRSRSTISRGDSLATEEPCVEELCVQDFRDYMGYAVIDKQQTRREPPLPPPRTPPRRKRSIQSDKISSEPKFFTVPRSSNSEPPQRPVRNYSTLGPSRPPRRKPPINMTDEEKENIDITQYIEIDEEPNRDLHSGEVIQKMRDRPLPAPPRPPRKTRTLQDITSQENIAIDDYDNDTENQEKDLVLEEAETEQHSPDFESEQLPEDPPTTLESITTADDPVIVERRLITPTHFTYEETITHGSLVVEPLNGAKLLPDSEITRIEKQEHIVPVTQDYDDETSEIPEEFTKLKDPPAVRTFPQPSVVVQHDPNSEIDVLKAKKLQVSDLDVDRLSVNELLANRIVVSEIESGNIQTGEINTKSGALKVGEIELPPAIVQQLFERLQSVAQEQSSGVSVESKEPPVEKSDTEGQKKTPIEEVAVETFPPQRPPRKTEETHEFNIDYVEEPQLGEGRPETSLNISETEEIKEIPDPPERIDSNAEIAETPQRPPRHAEKSESAKELEIDDEPPPRPPEPQIEYIPSQPPASFYALRAQQFVDDHEGDIPMAPRRRRHHHKPPISRSSSEDSPAPPPSRRRYKSPEPSIPQLTSQLIQACGSAANSSLKRLIAHISNNVLRNADGQQDLHVIVVILLVLIAGLILLGFGDGKTVHHHHWEFFNPPRDM